MSFLAGDEDTICALSTPEGHGGIAVVRVSGRDAVPVARRLCSFLPEKLDSHRVYYGLLHGTEDRAPIDEVLVSYFGEGKSFTGEHTVEISSHGSQFLSLAILKELQAAGARMARNGEFTYRAYMNGKMDLVQAEGVLGLIQSRTKLSSKAAINHLRGGLSRTYLEIENQIMAVVSQLEADIDFTHENLSTASHDVLLPKLQDASIKVKDLVNSYALGRQLREGCRILITGAPNVGKSSLMNALAGEEKSIVTSIPGTTRDLIEFNSNMFGVETVFIDSAGIHDSNDEIEIAGMQKAKSEMKACDYVILVVDLTKDIPNQIAEVGLSEKPALIVGNKADLVHRLENRDLVHVRCSVKENIGVDEVKNKIKVMLTERQGIDSHVVTQSRHVELLTKTQNSLERAISGMRENVSPELIVFELKEGVHAIHELLGIQVDDRVLDRIFKEFCIGK
jgi:tRNA modification GTPase